MARLTDDPNDPGLTHGVDEQPTPQAAVYLVLSAEERAKGFVRPVQMSYRHLSCGTNCYEQGLSRDVCKAARLLWGYILCKLWNASTSR